MSNWFAGKWYSSKGWYEEWFGAVKAPVPVPIPVGGGGGGGGGFISGVLPPLIREELREVELAAEGLYPAQIYSYRPEMLSSFAKRVVDKVRKDIADEKTRPPDPLGVPRKPDPTKARERDLRALRGQINTLKSEVRKLEARAGKADALAIEVERLRRVVQDLEDALAHLTARVIYLPIRYRPVVAKQAEPAASPWGKEAERGLDLEEIEREVLSRMLGGMEDRQLVRLLPEPKIGTGLAFLVAAIAMYGFTHDMIDEDLPVLRGAGYATAAAFAALSAKHLLR